jgi:hypothetical protein
MLTAALGRGLEHSDKCVVDDNTRALARDGYRFATLVQEIVRSDPFQKRKNNPGADDRAETITAKRVEGPGDRYRLALAGSAGALQERSAGAERADV